jgi:V/A-type H+/Na+-transporting ATPase subunit E
MHISLEGLVKGTDEPMSAETIVNKIKSDAEQKGVEIKKEAEKQAQTIKEEATNNAKKHADEILEKGKEQAENKKKIMISQAHQNAKRNEMNAKEEIIESCFTNAIERLAKMDDVSYNKLVKQLIEHGKKQISGSCTVRVSSERDKKISEKLGIPVTGKTDATGGIILQSKDGTITIDNTFEGILKREKQEIRVKVGKLLFNEQ